MAAGPGIFGDLNKPENNREFFLTFNKKLHRSANNGCVFVVGKRKIIPGVIFDVKSESEIRISLSRQNFEIFEVLRQKLLRKRPIAFQQQNLADLCYFYLF